ncbi:hypothetical protein SALBM217S_05482 [Streptomyces griseoloalbus]
MILAYGGRKHLTDWQVEVNHAIKETGLSSTPTPSSRCRPRPARCASSSSTTAPCPRPGSPRGLGLRFYAGHRVSEGAGGTIGTTYPFWQRHRYTRSQTFPRLHVVLAGKEEHLLDNRLQALAGDVQGIAVAVWVNTLPGSSAVSPGTRSVSMTRASAAGATRSP